VASSPEEWLRQSDYDMDTAEYMLRGGRRFYAVFMCHLAVEKAAKGLYQRRLNRVPPRTHNLVYLLGQLGLRPPGELGVFLVSLNEAQIPTRYPEDLATLSQQYTEEVSREMLRRGQEVLAWIKSQL